MAHGLIWHLKKTLIGSSKSRLGDYLLRRVNRKKSLYQLRYPNDLADLKRILIPADVILIEGDYRVSDWIKIFSTHIWSHCAIYVGDQAGPQSRSPKLLEDEEPNLVEAIIGRGVILSRLNKYQECNLRICRPMNLSRRQRDLVVRFVLSKVGLPYDEKNILRFAGLPFDDLARPTKNIGTSTDERYTCSSLIAAAFGKVGLEVLHYYQTETKKLVPYHNSQIQPKDFDLSPHFEIVKVSPPLTRMTQQKKFGLFALFRNILFKHKSA